MTLTSLIKKPPLTLGPDETIGNAARAMVEHGVGAATVVEARKIVGVVTERDVLKKVVAAGIDPATTRVRTIMTSPVFSVLANTTVAAAAELMRKHHIRHLVVLDESGAQVGMLSVRYLLYNAMDDLERKVDDLQNFVMTDGPGG